MAATWLAERGYGIVARNWTIHGDIRGEIDLVVRDGDVLAFVEVKTRRSQRFGGPLGAVRHAKQGQLRRLASAFLRDWDGYSPHLRFDVVAIIAPPGREPFVRHVTNAF